MFSQNTIDIEMLNTFYNVDSGVILVFSEIDLHLCSKCICEPIHIHRIWHTTGLQTYTT